jgi:inhibitor of KinA
VKVPNPIISSVGENAVTISLGNSIDLETHKIIFYLYNELLKSRQASWLDIIPAYTTVTIVYDVVAIRLQHACAFQWTKESVEKILENVQSEENVPARHIQVPVCYDEAFSLDGEHVAKEKNISFRELMDIHVSRIYQVFMIGFLPGFPYMGSVDPRIAAPRIATPRTNVSAGSVGIAGEQTGIYPLDSPGGWNIIGKTPLKIFDSNAPESVLFRPGDQVTFLPITKSEFESFNPSNFKLILDES